MPKDKLVSSKPFFALFEAQVRDSLERLGLQRIETYVVRVKLDEQMAGACSYSPESSQAMVLLSTKLQVPDATPDAVETIAIHESLELLLQPLTQRSEAMGADGPVMESLRHEVINALVAMIQRYEAELMEALIANLENDE